MIFNKKERQRIKQQESMQKFIEFLLKNDVLNQKEEIIAWGNGPGYLPDWKAWFDEKLINKGPSMMILTKKYMYFPEFKLNLDTAKEQYIKNGNKFNFHNINVFHEINISTKPKDYDFFLQNNLNSKSDRIIDGGHTFLIHNENFVVELEALFSGKSIVKTL